MTTPTSPPPSRWTRFIPWQFSLRGLLVVITVVTCLCWYLSPQSIGTITTYQANRVKRGMTKAQIISMLGNPISKTYNPQEWAWTYSVKDRFFKKKQYLYIYFRGDMAMWTLLGEFDHDEATFKAQAYGVGNAGS